MTLDGFLTFLTLIIAAYGIATETMRLRMRLHTLHLALVSLTVFAIVIYFETFAVFGRHCPQSVGTACRYLTINKLDDGSSPIPGWLAFAGVVIWICIALSILAQRAVASWALPTLQRLVDELVVERRFAELIKVAEPQIDLLTRASKRKLLFANWHDRLRDLNPHDDSMGIELLKQLEIETPPRTWRDDLRTWSRINLSRLAWLIPARRIEQEAADEILRVMHLTQPLVEFIALFRPATGVSFLKIPTESVHEFCDAYLVALAADPKSTLYVEVERNQNVFGCNRYAFPQSNRLLYFLLGDAKIAERLGIWKPIGEWLIVNLSSSRNPEYVKSLNLSSDSFEDEKWQDPCYTILRFFDLMVSAAEYQGIEWHMWLYYYPHFLDRLIKFYDDTGSDVDLLREMPTRAAYLIHELFRVMRAWILSVTDLDEGSPHLIMASVEPTHENGNIPKSAILAIGSCLLALFEAENVGARLKADIFEGVVRTIDHLPAEGPLSKFRTVMIASVIRGGSRFAAGERPAYLVWLRAQYSEVDWVLRDRLGDFEASLGPQG